MADLLLDFHSRVTNITLNSSLVSMVQIYFLEKLFVNSFCLEIFDCSTFILKYSELSQLGITQKLIKLQMMTTERSRVKVKIDNMFTNSFDASTGVNRVLSTILFVIAFEKAME